MDYRGGVIFFGLLAIGAIALALATRGKSTSRRSLVIEGELVARASKEPQAVATTYDNIEEIELLDIDEELLMPRKIIIHRKTTVVPND